MSRFPIIRLSIAAVLSVAPLLIVSPMAAAATLTAGNVQAAPGATQVTLPLTLTLAPNDTISGLQANLVFDTQVLTLTGIEVGPTAASSSKKALHNIFEPGHARVVVFGLNQNPISDGIVANALFNVAAGTSLGPKEVALDSAAATNPEGLPIQTTGVAGSITIVQGGEGEGEGEGETPGGCMGGTLDTPPGSGTNGAIILVLAVSLLLLAMTPCRVNRRSCDRPPR